MQKILSIHCSTSRHCSPLTYNIGKISTWNKEITLTDGYRGKLLWVKFARKGLFQSSKNDRITFLIVHQICVAVYILCWISLEYGRVQKSDFVLISEQRAKDIIMDFEVTPFTKINFNAHPIYSFGWGTLKTSQSTYQKPMANVHNKP